MWIATVKPEEAVKWLKDAVRHPLFHRIEFPCEPSAEELKVLVEAGYASKAGSNASPPQRPLTRDKFRELCVSDEERARFDAIFKAAPPRPVRDDGGRGGMGR